MVSSHGRRAEAALERRVARERLRDALERVALAEALDGGHLAPVGLGGEIGAGADRLAVHQHGAGAADLDVARALRTGEPQAVAQDVEQQLVRFDLDRRAAPLRRDLDAHEPSCPSRGGPWLAPHAAPRRPSSRRAGSSWYFRGRSFAHPSWLIGNAPPSELAMDWKRMARSRVSAVSTPSARPRPRRRRHGCAATRHAGHPAPPRPAPARMASVTRAGPSS